ncbi:hypothetical protein A2U01_0107860, partial [Trifolium medium]|nr:hypothetical protein [Trifolium medium]
QSHTASTTHRRCQIQHLHFSTSPPHPHITSDSDPSQPPPPPLHLRSDATTRLRSIAMMLGIVLVLEYT